MSAPALAVMYHYVRADDRQRWPGLFPLEPREFEAQLDFLEHFGDIVGPETFGVGTPERPQILLTFDDGTRDHYTQVFPILRQRGLVGLFGVMSGPTVDRHMPAVHLAHAVLSSIPDEEVWSRLGARFSQSRLGNTTESKALYVYDEPLRARIKFTLNFGLRTDESAAFLQSCLEERGELDALLDAWYLTDDQIREMHRAGMRFAVHAHHHLAYQSPASSFYDRELRPCATWLADLTGSDPVDYIAAFGGSNAHDDNPRELEALLTQQGYRRAFLTEKGVENAPLKGLFCKRVDSAELPPRQSAACLDGLLVEA